MPESPINEILKPVSRVIDQEFTCSIILFVCVIQAITWVNSIWPESYHHCWEMRLMVGFSSYLFRQSLHIGSEFFPSLMNPVGPGVALGLLIGKFTGMFGLTWNVARAGLSELPDRATRRHIVGIALLAGVGVTMLFFITHLAFGHAEMIDQSKYGILLASLIAGISGIAFLKTIKS
jgi:Na+/H+ antiporter NhaA